MVSKNKKSKSLKNDQNVESAAKGPSKWLKATATPPTAVSSSHNSSLGTQSTAYPQIDKHSLYAQSVQSPAEELKTIQNLYRTHSLASPVHNPFSLREDFCGTAILCAEWIKSHPLRTAIGIDISSEVLNYARQNIIQGNEERIQLVQSNVLEVNIQNQKDISKVDVIVALNYGVCHFHKRADLIRYLKIAKEGLKKGGILICDLFGGRSIGNRKVVRKFKDFTYQFTQSNYNIRSSTILCDISFFFPPSPPSPSSKSNASESPETMETHSRHRKFYPQKLSQKQKPMLKAFSYHFRVYSITDLEEAMYETGFKEVNVYVAKAVVDNGVNEFEEDDDVSSRTEERRGVYAGVEEEESEDESAGEEKDDLEYKYVKKGDTMLQMDAWNGLDLISFFNFSSMIYLPWTLVLSPSLS
ncbi:S-adenosyl-L-methionine-dependent methyltransferase [Paraphysoderma sedebokerense]|nr:S-adenosyl-L-methionine-dependent methyltransferase [Paraphysoderma sedebokerense]